MNIALFGRGHTGREIEILAPARGHSIAGIFTSRNPLTESGMAQLRASGVQCCIDFSTPQTVVPNILLCLREHIPIVVGTTGWHERLPEVRALVERHNGALVHASNFSAGAHIYFKLIAEAARYFNTRSEFDASVHETHHRMKKDSPSGTARTIAGILIEQLERKRVLRTDASQGPIAPEELSVSSARVGSVFGTHTVTFSGEAEDIELTHRAHNRKGFAAGALTAAEWVQGRTGVFTAEDVFF